MAEYTIPLRKKYYKAPRHERSKKAVNVLREYLKRHTKADEVKIGQHLNEFVWARGIRSPPPRVTVVSNVVDIDGLSVAQVELKGHEFKQSVRPEERVEEEGGLKGKLQALTQGKDKEQEAPEVKDTTQKPAEKAEEKEAPKKAAAKAAAKTQEAKE